MTAKDFFDLVARMRDKQKEWTNRKNISEPAPGLS